MTAVARALVAAAVHLLPRVARRRYREELEAELGDLRGPRRLTSAASVLAWAPRLRWDVLAGLSGGRTSRRCYLGLHGRRVVHPNPEDHRIVALACDRCGRTRDPRQYDDAPDASGVAWGGVHLSGGTGL